MGMGEQQLRTLVNLIRYWPERVSTKRTYHGHYKIPKSSKTHGVLGSLEARGLADNKPFEDMYGHKINQWRITMLGLYHVVYLPDHHPLWHKQARKHWRAHIRGHINYWIPKDIRVLLETYDPPSMIQSEA